MPEKENLPSHTATPLEPQTLKLPAEPTFEKKPKVKDEEHKRWPKPKGPYRPIKGLGKPTRAPEIGSDSPSPKR
jgi:hypothetical protein